MLNLDLADVGFIVGGVVFVAGIALLKPAVAVIVAGLLVMSFSYLSVTPEQKKPDSQ
jgi:hypothetical protein